MGSANWIIQTDYEKIAYVSGSTTLTTHPKPMHQNALRNVNVLIITALTQTPTSNPDSMLGELCINTGMILLVYCLKYCTRIIFNELPFSSDDG